MAWLNTIETEFSAAHSLRNYEGDCKNNHGHNWKVIVCYASYELNDQGMVADFKTVKKATNEILEELDHTYINDHSHFKKHNPTSENVAKWIFDQLLEKKLPPIGFRWVQVWENSRSSSKFGYDI